MKVPDWLQIYTLLRFGCGDELSGSVLSRNVWFVFNESSKSQGHFETQKVTIFETLTPSSFAVKTLRKTKLSVLLENTRIYIQTEFRPSCTFFLGVARPRSFITTPKPENPWKSLNLSPWSEGNFVIFVKVPDWLQIYTLLRFGCGDELSGSVLSRNVWFVFNESSKSQGHFETQKVTIFETLTPSSFAVKTLR